MYSADWDPIVDVYRPIRIKKITCLGDEIVILTKNEESEIEVPIILEEGCIHNQNTIKEIMCDSKLVIEKGAINNIEEITFKMYKLNESLAKLSKTHNLKMFLLNKETLDFDEYILPPSSTGGRTKKVIALDRSQFKLNALNNEKIVVTGALKHFTRKSIKETIEKKNVSFKTYRV